VAGHGVFFFLALYPRPFLTQRCTTQQHLSNNKQSYLRECSLFFAAAPNLALMSCASPMSHIFTAMSRSFTGAAFSFSSPNLECLVHITNLGARLAVESDPVLLFVIVVVV